MLDESQILKICNKYDFICPICNTFNAFYRLKRDICRPLNREEDGHPQSWRWSVEGYENIDPKLFMFGTCRSCFHTGELDNVEFRVSPRDPEKFCRLFSEDGLKKIRNRGEGAFSFSKALGLLAVKENSIIGAIARIHLGVFSKCLQRKIVPGDIARYYLRLAWLYRDQEKYFADEDMVGIKEQLDAVTQAWQNEFPENVEYKIKPEIALDESSALRLSREFFQLNYQSLRKSSAQDELRLRYLMAEIGFRLYFLDNEENDYKIAIGYYGGLMKKCLTVISDKSITGGIINRSRDILEKCGERGREMRQLNKDRKGPKQTNNKPEKIKKKIIAKKIKTAFPLGKAKKEAEKEKKVSVEKLKVGEKEVQKAHTKEKKEELAQSLVLERKVRQLQARVEQLKADINNWEDLAGKDGLTGLHNKITLFKIVLPKLLATLPSASPLAFIALTLDEVGQADLRHGWALGDRLLKQAASDLTQLIHSDEALYCLEGAQFIITSELARDAAQIRIRDIQKQLTKENVNVDTVTIPLRASFSLVTTDKTPAQDGEEMANRIYQTINKLLYKARGNSDAKIEHKEI